MPRDDPYSAPAEGANETMRYERNMEAVRNQRRLRRALARTKAAIRAAQSRGETPRSALLTRETEMRGELAVMNHQLAVRRGKTPRESVTAELDLDMSSAQE